MSDSILAEVLKLLNRIENKQDDLAATLADHVATEEGDWHQMKESLASLQSGFPNNDPIGHAEYHIDMIQILEERKAFWHKMREKLTEWGLIGFVGFCFYAIGDEIIDVIRAKLAAKY